MTFSSPFSLEFHKKICISCLFVCCFYSRSYLSYTKFLNLAVCGLKEKWSIKIERWKKKIKLLEQSYASLKNLSVSGGCMHAIIIKCSLLFFFFFSFQTLIMIDDGIKISTHTHMELVQYFVVFIWHFSSILWWNEPKKERESGRDP